MTEQQNPPENEPAEDQQDQPAEDQQDEQEQPSADELAKQLKKANDAATRRERELRKAQEALAKLRKEVEPAQEADKVAVANQKLVAAEVRTQLAAVGITDSDDRREVVEILNLAGVDVDDAGEVDTDAIEKKIAALRRIFGKTATAARAPRVDTRDRGRQEPAKTRDQERWGRIFGPGR